MYNVIGITFIFESGDCARKIDPDFSNDEILAYDFIFYYE